ncbi:MAG: glutamine--fructose-6-phosphate aminotransferase, partial [Planctomycetota bacterium]
MCGIVAYIGTKPAADLLIEGLKRLEYRGYDSAGVAVLNDSGIKLERAVGRVANVEAKVDAAGDTFRASLGMAHTRWAT